jgi:osmotically-inducible protein OsmY
MKRFLFIVVALSLLSTAFAAQNNGAKPPAKAKPTVDCTNVSDSKITEDVRAKLAAAKSLADLSIDVATSAGVVTLTGMAKKPTQKGTATRVARAVPCVKKVDNQLTVEAAASKPKE